MGEALGHAVPLAAGIAVFPIPVIAVVLILGSARGQVNALAFVVAWVVGLAAVGAAVLLVAGEADASDGGEPATRASALVLGAGLVLVGLAVRQWRSRRVRPGRIARRAVATRDRARAPRAVGPAATCRDRACHSRLPGGAVHRTWAGELT